MERYLSAAQMLPNLSFSIGTKDDIVKMELTPCAKYVLNKVAICSKRIRRAFFKQLELNSKIGSLLLQFR